MTTTKFTLQCLLISYLDPNKHSISISLSHKAYYNANINVNFIQHNKTMFYNQHPRPLLFW